MLLASRLENDLAKRAKVFAVTLKDGPKCNVREERI